MDARRVTEPPVSGILYGDLRSPLPAVERGRINTESPFTSRASPSRSCSRPRIGREEMAHSGVDPLPGMLLVLTGDAAGADPIFATA